MITSIEYEKRRREDGTWQIGRIERLDGGSNNYTVVGEYDEEPELPDAPLTEAERVARLEAQFVALLDLLTSSKAIDAAQAARLRSR